jgi:hypothetical protein
MILASILISSAEQDVREPPQAVRENIDSFKKACAGIEHRLFTHAHIREFLAKEFGTDVLSAYDSLKPYTYKADLAKYCIIHHFGGVYADLSVYFLRRWPPAPAEIANSTDRIGIFRGGDFAPWSVPPTLFSAPKGHKALGKVIDLVCENVRKKYYGSTPLCPTGPVLFGKALAMTCEPAEILNGKYVWVDPQGKMAKLISEKNIAFAFNDRLIAVRRKRGGGPQTELGLVGGNQYTGAWKARDIYC